MSLVWHMVWKDCRRLALPLGLWLVLVLLHTGLLAVYRGDSHAEANAFVGLLYYTYAVGAIVTGVGFILAAWLVMEDSLVETRAFWPTRPISGSRLLAAKALGAFLMFSVAPVLVLAPVWLGCGFSLRELQHAAWQQAAVQGLCSVAAFVIAGVTAKSGQFLVRVVGVAILVPLGMSFATTQTFILPVPRTTGVMASQHGLTALLLFITPLAVIIHQYLTRRTARTWAVGGCGVALIVAVALGWKWDISTLIRFGAGRDTTEAPELRAVTVDIGPLRILPAASSPERRLVRLEGSMRGAPGGAYLRLNPAEAEWMVNEDRVPLYRRLHAQAGAAQPPAVAGLQVAGLLPAASEAHGPVWSIEGEELQERVDRASAARMPLVVNLNLTLMRGHLLGELPLQVGAELSSGACHTRILGIEREAGKVRVRLEDRDFSPSSFFEPGNGAGLTPARGGADCFVVLHRSSAGSGSRAAHANGVLQVTGGTTIGTLGVHAVLVGQRELTFDPPTREVNGVTEEIPDWEKETFILQVRFRPENTFTRPLVVNPFAS